MLTGDIPFYAENRKVNRQRILKDKPKFATFLSGDAVLLLRSLLEKEPQLR